MLLLAAAGFVFIILGCICYFKGTNWEAKALGLVMFYLAVPAFFFGLISWAMRQR